MKIQGYLESEGIIVKISSVEDIKNFLEKLGRTINEITEIELDKLVFFKVNSIGNTYDLIDDCYVKYKNNPLICLTCYNAFLKPFTFINSYKIKDGTIAINQGAFRKHHNEVDRFESVYMPDTIIIIGPSAFQDRTLLKHVKLPNNLLKIGGYAFSNCLSLTTLEPFKSLKYIGAFAFKNSGIKTITIPASTIKIGSGAFSNCQLLNSVTFEGVPMDIGSNIFGQCPNLSEIKIPHGSFEYFEKALFPLNKEIIKEN